MIDATKICTLTEAHVLVGRTRMPYPTGELLRKLGFTYQPAPDLRKRAITYQRQKIVKVRPATEVERRFVLGHELGHICSGHPAALAFCPRCGTTRHYAWRAK